MVVLPIPDPADAYRQAAPERYWRSVEETLERVFAAGDHNQAALYRGRLAAYRASLRTAGPDEQVLVHHAEPLDVAADLAGAAVTDAILKDYDRLVRNTP